MGAGSGAAAAWYTAQYTMKLYNTGMCESVDSPM